MLGRFIGIFPVGWQEIVDVLCQPSGAIFCTSEHAQRGRNKAGLRVIVLFSIIPSTEMFIIRFSAYLEPNPCSTS
jgi:hypothetical protein